MIDGYSKESYSYLYNYIPSRDRYILFKSLDGFEDYDYCENLISLYISTDLSQKALAKATGISQYAISKDLIKIKNALIWYKNNHKQKKWWRL